MGLIGGTTDQGGFHFQRQVQDLEDLDGLCDDFGADAVTGKNCDFHDFWEGFELGFWSGPSASQWLSRYSQALNTK